jgi:phage major head subunit gpT-like protein
MALDTARTVATLRGLTAKFDAGAEKAAPLYPTLCTMVPSAGADEKYGFLGAMPGMREWLGDRQFQTLAGGDYTLANKEWESSVAIQKKDIKDDRLGMYGPVLEQLGLEAAYHPDELLVTAIEAGESTACFDGQYFFDTDHSWGSSGTQDNDLTGAAATNTNPTAAELKAAFQACVDAMLGFKNDKGKYLNRPVLRKLNDLTLVVPIAFRTAAHNAFDALLSGNGETNVVIDRPNIVCLPGLSGGARMYVFATGGILKPFVFQEREPLARQMKGMDDAEFKDVKFMTDARYNLGYLAWWNAVLYTFT